MAIQIDNIVYRNLQEQVQKNKEDIAGFKSIQFTLNNLGITVLGVVATEQDIPEREYEYGDAWLVGASEPYDIYIYTRSDVEGEGIFVNMGALSIQGPQGPQGPKGEDGTNGTNGINGTSVVGKSGPTNPVTTGDEHQGDIYINTTTNYLWMFKNGSWVQTLYIKGEQGEQGQTGPQGATGTSLSIVAKLTSTSLLPTDFASGTIPKNSAYLIPDSNSQYHLWIILGDQDDYSTWHWSDAGIYPNPTSRPEITDMAFFEDTSTTVEYDEESNVAHITGNSTVSYNDSTQDAVMGDLILPIEAGDNVSLGVNDAGTHLVISASGGGAGGGMELLWSGSVVIDQYNESRFSSYLKDTNYKYILMRFSCDQSETMHNSVIQPTISTSGEVFCHDLTFTTFSYNKVYHYLLKSTEYGLQLKNNYYYYNASGSITTAQLGSFVTIKAIYGIK